MSRVLRGLLQQSSTVAVLSRAGYLQAHFADTHDNRATKLRIANRLSQIRKDTVSDLEVPAHVDTLHPMTWATHRGARRFAAGRLAGLEHDLRRDTNPFDESHAKADMHIAAHIFVGRDQIAQYYTGVDGNRDLLTAAGDPLAVFVAAAPIFIALFTAINLADAEWLNAVAWLGGGNYFLPISNWRMDATEKPLHTFERSAQPWRLFASNHTVMADASPVDTPIEHVTDRLLHSAALGYSPMIRHMWQHLFRRFVVTLYHDEIFTRGADGEPTLTVALRATKKKPSYPAPESEHASILRPALAGSRG